MIRLISPDDAADEYPFDLPPYPMFDRVLVIDAFSLTALVAFRWRPILRWRFLSRAWQGSPRTGEILATDWTGRERELIGWEWPLRVQAWTASQLAAALFHHEFARDVLPVFPMWYVNDHQPRGYVWDPHRPELTS